jgi:hypothetical protein
MTDSAHTLSEDELEESRHGSRSEPDFLRSGSLRDDFAERREQLA